MLLDFRVIRFINRDMENKRERLFAEFPPIERQQWLDKITVDLKGADFGKKLVWRTSEGFNVQPFYMRQDVEDLPQTRSMPGQFPFVRGNKASSNEWYVRQNIDCSDVRAANAKALDVLNRGVDSLGFVLTPEQVSSETLDVLLDGFYPEAIELNFATQESAIVKLGAEVLAWLKRRGADLGQVHGSIAADPIGETLATGRNVLSYAGQLKELVEMFDEVPGFTVVSVNTLELVDAGAFSYQESGYGLAWGNEYMHLLTEAGVDARKAARKLRFETGVGINYFMEIAKMRALRMLWAQILKEYGVPEAECYTYIQATTTEFNKTLFDSHINLLRTQTEAMSASLAGADSIVVTGFDTTYEKATDFSERIARNQQLMLKEENHFSRIVDVAGGSYYIETLTQSLAKEAWKLFLGVEEAGGMLKQVESGEVQAAINATNADRHKKAAQRREFILGTNQFPNFNELSEGKEPLEQPQFDGATLPALNKSRLSSQFEALRLQTEKAAKRPLAFMLTIGDLKWRQARAQFSCNFLAPAGYEVKDNLGFPTVEEGVEAAVAAGADIVVLCSSDAEYADYGIPAFEALAGRAMFVIAGAPECADKLKEAGIEYFIHVRVNQLETLQLFNSKLGI